MPRRYMDARDYAAKVDAKNVKAWARALKRGKSSISVKPPKIR